MEKLQTTTVIIYKYRKQYKLKYLRSQKFILIWIKSESKRSRTPVDEGLRVNVKRFYEEAERRNEMNSRSHESKVQRTVQTNK